MSDPISVYRQQAEQIVRSHDWRCDGERFADRPYCSCAPDGRPLCAGCGKLADAIASALAAAATTKHRCSGCGLRWENLPGAELCGDCWRQVQPALACTCGEALSRRGEWRADCPAAKAHERLRDWFSRCPLHYDPLICLGCEADEAMRPEWVDVSGYRLLASTHRFPPDPFAEQLSAAIFALCTAIEAVVRERDQLRASALAGAARPQWQSIETAPKDGTLFIALLPSGAVGAVKVDGVRVGGHWWFEHRTSRVYREDELRGWMPLPAEPLSVAPPVDTK